MLDAPRTLIAIVCLGLFMLGCSRAPEAPHQFGSAASQLTPLDTPLAGPLVHRTVYVPIYSSLYEGINRNTVELSATVSVRNVSGQHPLVLNSVRYYDSRGKKVRDYLDHPAKLGSLASVEFVIQREDTTGGPGANLLVEWSGAADIDEPILEAVMFGQVGAVGISFTSPGRTLKNSTESNHSKINTH